MKIVTIIGARPQFIKAAVISRAIKEYDSIKEVIVHTGQHFDSNMSDVFFDEMSIPRPDYNLNINSLGHGAMTGQMIEKIEEILQIESPEWVLVYGDTNSTLAGALAAKKMHIKVAHVEAGLRSFNMDMPEEINRILTDRISDLLFCPTLQAIDNLLIEGYDNFKSEMLNVGDVMQDAAIFYSEKAKSPSIKLPSQFILCTIHRAENTDDITKLKEIFKALEEISESIKIILPLHPRTKHKLQNINYPFDRSNIYFIEPVGYLEMVWLLKNCRLVMTDSGGLQKEAYFFNKYCITLREETEWVELLENKVNILVGSDYNKIRSTALSVLDNSESSVGRRFEIGLYGNGNSGTKIVEKLVSHLSL